MPIVLFIISPFLSLLYSIKRLDHRFCGMMFVLFCGIFGYCNDFSLQTSDCYRIALWFQTTVTSSDIIDEFVSGKLPDIYLPFLYKIVKVFTSNPKVLYLFIGLVYGYFYYRIIEIVYHHVGFCSKNIFWTLMFVVICNISIIEIMGVRYYTGALIYVYSIYNVICCHQRRWLLGIAIIPLIHFGHLFNVVIFLIYWGCKKFHLLNIKILCRVMTICCILSFLPIKNGFHRLVTSKSGMINNEMVEFKMSVYSGDVNNLGKSMDAGSTYRKANNLFFSIFRGIYKICLCCILLRLCTYIDWKDDYFHLLCFTLLLTAVAYIASAVSIGGSGFRYVTIAGELSIILVSIIIAFGISNTRIFIYLLPIMCIPQIAFLLFNAPRLVTPLLWFMNLPYLIYEGIGFSVM